MFKLKSGKYYQICRVPLLAIPIAVIPLCQTLKAFPLEELKFFKEKPSITMNIKNPDKIGLPTGNEESYGISYSVENMPVIPDIRVKYVHLHSSGKKTLDRDFSYADLNFKSGTELHSKITGDNIKLTFYYQPLDRFNYDFINIELGANLLFIDYKLENTFEYKGGYSKETDTLSTMIPSLHLKVSLNPIYYLKLSIKGALPIGNKTDREFECEAEYFLNPQLYLFSSYNYSYTKAHDINGFDFKTTSRGVSFGLGLLW